MDVFTPTNDLSLSQNDRALITPELVIAPCKNVPGSQIVNQGVRSEFSRRESNGKSFTSRGKRAFK